MDTLIETVPEGPSAEAPSPPRRARWKTGVAAAAAVLGAALGGAALVPTDDYRIAPGAADPVDEILDASGTPTYSAAGEVLFTTVEIGPMSWLERWWNERDESVDIVPKELILGTKTRTENREENLRVMGASKETATYVALRHLGYQVAVTGGGVLVADIDPEAPAAAALARGDLITAVDGGDVQLPVDLRAALRRRQPGDEVTITVARDGVPSEQRVTLMRSEDGRAIIGIAPAIPDTVRFAFPVAVDLDTESTGGPSAGLAFTLGLLDLLTPGELTGGQEVAATGAIDLEGNVLPVGGVRQKAVAVRRAGASLFLVPASEVEEARRGAGDVRVVGVETLDDALAALAELGGNAAQVAGAAAVG